MNSKLEIKNTDIDGNISEESPNIFATESNIRMESNMFTNHSCKLACYLRIETRSIFEDINSIFRNAKAKEWDGVAIISNESTANFKNSKFINNTAPKTANLNVREDSTVNMTNVEFNESYSLTGSACIKSEQSRINIFESSFTLFQSTAILMQNSDSLKMLLIEDSKFEHGGS